LPNPIRKRKIALFASYSHPRSQLRPPVRYAKGPEAMIMWRSLRPTDLARLFETLAISRRPVRTGNLAKGGTATEMTFRPAPRRSAIRARIALSGSDGAE
jgi:hypothetical protein